jgi:hypothetical protein
MLDTALRPNRPAPGLGPVMQRLRERKEWKLLGVLAKVARAWPGLRCC